VPVIDWLYTAVQYFSHYTVHTHTRCYCRCHVTSSWCLWHWRLIIETKTKSLRHW